MSDTTRKRRLSATSEENLSAKVKFTRRAETFSCAKLIHWSTDDDKDPAITGLLDTLRSVDLILWHVGYINQDKLRSVGYINQDKLQSVDLILWHVGYINRRDHLQMQ